GGEGRSAARRLHPHLDRRPEQVHRARVPAGRHAAQLRPDNQEGGSGYARAVPDPVVPGRREVTSIAAHPEHHHVEAPTPPVRGWRRFLAPGYLRCLWTIPLMFGFG